jgi:DNA (cytosine-5)-methyltransferase 1
MLQGANAMRRLRVISLFTGAGGLDYGFEAAGFVTAVAVEMDTRCIQTLKASRPNWSVIGRDIAGVKVSEILDAAQLGPGDADVLIGGPPCQPFSKSGFWADGAAKRLDDPRAGTLKDYLRVLAGTLPRAFLLENVEGLGFRGKAEALGLIEAQLRQINARHGTQYRPSISVLNAADFGVPQVRRRMFVIGSRDGGTFRFPTATHVDSRTVDLFDSRPRYRTAWEALHDLDEPMDELLMPKGKWADLLPSIPEGQNYLWHTDRGGGEQLFGWRRRYWSFLLKLAKDQPSWTIQAQPGPATGPFHWNNRRLSVEEMARLQTFPRNVTFYGSYADSQSQLGNAVPSLLAEVLARAIGSQLFERDSSRYDLLLAAPPVAARCPGPESTKSVPAKYHQLRGNHSPHPGTGKGTRASLRGQADVTA